MLALFSSTVVATLPSVASFIPRPDVASHLHMISSARVRGEEVDPQILIQALQACIRAKPLNPAILYRLWEESLLSGVQYKDLDVKLADSLRGRLPPEAPETIELLEHPNDSSLGPLLNDELPNLWVQPLRRVDEFDCTNEEGIAAAWDSVSKNSVPVLFRGIGRHWKALDSWSLSKLGQSLPRGMVRISPGPAVTFCRESHPAVQSKLFTPPSRLLSMRGSEFVQRLHPGRGGLPPVLYDDNERVYLQALAPPSLMSDVDFSFLPDVQPSSVLGRLWVSTPGTYSPLHYDEQVTETAPACLRLNSLRNLCLSGLILVPGEGSKADATVA